MTIRDKIMMAHYRIANTSTGKYRIGYMTNEQDKLYVASFYNRFLCIEFIYLSVYLYGMLHYMKYLCETRLLKSHFF